MAKDRKIVLDEGGVTRTYGELLRDSTLRDYENPSLLLRMTAPRLLRLIAEGRIDMVALAKCEIESRGFETTP